MEFIRIEIIETLAPNIYLIKCAYCDGRGFAPEKMKADKDEIGTFYKVSEWNNYLLCPICNGKTALKIESDDDILIRCVQCRGTGHNPIYGSKANEKCEVCHGIGVRSLTGECKVMGKK